MATFMDMVQDTMKTAGTMLGEGAKKAGVMVNEQVETAKLKAKISGEKKAIDAIYLEIGEYMYDKFLAGDEVDEKIKQFAADIDAHKAVIWDLQGQMDEVGMDE